MTQRAVKAAIWLLPAISVFALYRAGFGTWFMADDFAWLSLLHRLQVRHDLFHELFAPAAQGTLRPWSERAFFIVLEWLFGLEAWPFRAVVFATAAADTLLITWITRRATGSRLAGFLAPLLWIVNTALVRSMIWTSAYNEILCPLFLLAALALFIRYIETGRAAFWWWQLVVFILGFGALEINIVYPALAASWVLFVPRDFRVATVRESVFGVLRTLLPLAAVSAVYFILHRLAAPIPKSGPYALHLDLSILKTLALYCKWSLLPEPIERFGYTHRHAVVLLATASLGLAAYILTELRNRRKAVLFYLSWFLVTIAPVLPLADHHTDYYPTIPLIGIAMLGAAAAGQYWNSSMTRKAVLQRILVAVPLVAYLWAMVPVTAAVINWWRLKSLPVRALVLGVQAARQTHPGKAIALDGIQRELFDLSLAHSPFLVASVDDVYLTPGSALKMGQDPDSADPQTLELDPDIMGHAVTHDDVVVYSLESDHLRNITEGFKRQLASRTVDRLPARVDVGNSLYSWLLGPTWLPPESGIRWMPGSATLRLGVPIGGTQLELEGRCPEAQLLAASRHLMVLVDGVVGLDTRIYDPESNFHRLIPIPALLTGKTSVEIEIQVTPVDRTDGQDYGLVFGKIGIRP